MVDQGQREQLLHLVFGGELTDMDRVEIPEFDTVQIRELVAEDEMQQLFALALIHH